MSIKNLEIHKSSISSKLGAIVLALSMALSTTSCSIEGAGIFKSKAPNDISDKIGDNIELKHDNQKKLVFEIDSFMQALRQDY